MARNHRYSLGGALARRDIAVALMVLGAGCAPEPTGLRVTFAGQPPRLKKGALHFKVFATQDARSCAALEAMVVPRPPVPEVELIASREVQANEWPAAIDLVAVRVAGRAFGVVLVSNVPHATFCSESGLHEVEAQVHLLRTRPGPAMHLPRARFSAIPLGSGRRLVVGGHSGTAVEVFEPELDAFALSSPLILGRWAHAAALLPDGRVLVSGGLAPSGAIAMPRVELLDPDGGPSTLAASMEFARELHAATALANGSVLVTGGWSRVVTLGSAEVFEPVSGTWRVGGELGTARFRHTSTLLPDGTVLIAGGANATGPLASTELYDPATRTFSPGPSLESARERHVAVLLTDGSVLIAGGGGPNAERYLPATRTFVPAGTLSVTDDAPCATLLPSGQVAFSGESQVVQLFDPLTSTWSANAVLSMPRQGCVAWAALDAGVLFAGGGDSNHHHASTEIIEP